MLKYGNKTAEAHSWAGRVEAELENSGGPSRPQMDLGTRSGPKCISHSGVWKGQSGT